MKKYRGKFPSFYFLITFYVTLAFTHRIARFSFYLLCLSLRLSISIISTWERTQISDNSASFSREISPGPPKLEENAGPSRWCFRRRICFRSPRPDFRFLLSEEEQPVKVSRSSNEARDGRRDQRGANSRRGERKRNAIRRNRNEHQSPRQHLRRTVEPVVHGSRT